MHKYKGLKIKKYVDNYTGLVLYTIQPPYDNQNLYNEYLKLPYNYGRKLKEVKDVIDRYCEI